MRRCKRRRCIRNSAERRAHAGAAPFGACGLGVAACARARTLDQISFHLLPSSVKSNSITFRTLHYVAHCSGSQAGGLRQYYNVANIRPQRIYPGWARLGSDMCSQTEKKMRERSRRIQNGG